MSSVPDGEAKLMSAVRFGDSPRVRELLDMGVLTQSPDFQTSELFYEAYKTSMGKILEILTLLINAGMNVNEPTCRNTQTPLHYAIMTPHPFQMEIVALLLAHNADPNIRDLFGRAPLHSALHPEANYELVCALIAAGADVNAQTSVPAQITVLEDAVDAGDHFTIATLLAHGARVGTLLQNTIEPQIANLLRNAPNIRKRHVLKKLGRKTRTVHMLVSAWSRARERLSAGAAMEE